MRHDSTRPRSMRRSSALLRYNTLHARMPGTDVRRTLRHDMRRPSRVLLGFDRSRGRCSACTRSSTEHKAEKDCTRNFK
jgi:hypothetical protein